jgi:type I restriction enzyme R subunit
VAVSVTGDLAGLVVCLGGLADGCWRMSGSLPGKDRFIVVDAVGIMDTPLAETVQPLERTPTQSLQDLFKRVGFGSKDPQVASSIAGRLARLDKHLTKDDRAMLTGLAAGTDLGTMAQRLVDALDPDQQIAATVIAGQSADDPAAVAATADAMLTEALEPLATNHELRNAILDVRKSYEQTIDETSIDNVLFAGHSAEARDRASALVSSFQEYIEVHKDDIRALQVLYSRPYGERLTFSEIKELAKAIERPPRQWTPDALWHAYKMLDESKVHGGQAEAQRVYNERVWTPQTLRTRDEVARFFDGLELIEPGLVQIHQWRPAPDEFTPDGVVSAHGGVGRKA